MSAAHPFFPVVAVAASDILAHVDDIRQSGVVLIGNLIPQFRDSADSVFQVILHKEVGSGLVPVPHEVVESVERNI